MKCENCGAEMQYFESDGSCGMTCPVCSWGWATTYSAPIDQDMTEYTITVPRNENPDLASIKSISKLCGSNFNEAKQLLQSSDFSKNGRAREIQEYASTLRNTETPFAITPDFPYDFEDLKH